MATIHVPDALVGEIEAVVEKARKARLAQIDREIAILERERDALRNGSAGGRPGGASRTRLTDDEFLNAIRDGATTATKLAGVLHISVPTASARVRRLVEEGRVTAEGERRTRRLSVT